jgi:hypothetical protein
VIRGGVNGGNINALMETVEFVIDSPQVASRNYTAFNWAKYDGAVMLSFYIECGTGPGKRKVFYQPLCGIERPLQPVVLSFYMHCDMRWKK